MYVLIAMEKFCNISLGKIFFRTLSINIIDFLKNCVCSHGYAIRSGALPYM